MPTISIPLRLTRQNTLTRLSAASGYASVTCGTVGDDNACELVFQCDPEYDGAILKLYFDGAAVFPDMRRYVIPRALTKNKKLALEAAFVRDGVELEHSNTVALLFRDGLTEQGPVPDPLPDPDREALYRGASEWIANIDKDASDVVFVNMDGVEQFRLPYGFPGSDGHTPQRGVDYWTTADQASIVQDVLSALPSDASLAARLAGG